MAQAQAEAAPAAQQAHYMWSVQEILDIILLKLPLIDIVRCRQVARQWRDSEPAQRAIFLRPTRNLRIDYSGKKWVTTGHSDPQKNGLELTENPIINPLINEFLIQVDDGYDDPANEGVYFKHYGFINPAPMAYGEKQIEDRPLTRREEYFQRKHALWKKMLVMQPPAVEISFGCGRQNYNWGEEYEETEEQLDRFDEERARIVVKNPRGVTLGELVAAYRKHWFVCPMCMWWAREDLELQDKWYFIGNDQVNVMEDDIAGEEILAEMSEIKVIQESDGEDVE